MDNRWRPGVDRGCLGCAKIPGKPGAAVSRCSRLPDTDGLLSRGSQVRVLPGAPTRRRRVGHAWQSLGHAAARCAHRERARVLPGAPARTEFSRATAGRPSERAEVPRDSTNEGGPGAPAFARTEFSRATAGRPSERAMPQRYYTTAVTASLQWLEDSPAQRLQRVCSCALRALSGPPSLRALP